VIILEVFVTLPKEIHELGRWFHRVQNVIEFPNLDFQRGGIALNKLEILWGYFN
jgi:hypothetical protein